MSRVKRLNSGCCSVDCQPAMRMFWLMAVVKLLFRAPRQSAAGAAAASGFAHLQIIRKLQGSMIHQWSEQQSVKTDTTLSIEAEIFLLDKIIVMDDTILKLLRWDSQVWIVETMVSQKIEADFVHITCLAFVKTWNGPFEIFGWDWIVILFFRMTDFLPFISVGVWPSAHHRQKLHSQIVVMIDENQSCSTIHQISSQWNLLPSKSVLPVSVNWNCSWSFPVSVG